MNKEKVDLSKLTMPADEFDEMMRAALGTAAPAPDEQEMPSSAPEPEIKAGPVSSRKRIKRR